MFAHIVAFLGSLFNLLITTIYKIGVSIIAMLLIVLAMFIGGIVLIVLLLT